MSVFSRLFYALAMYFSAPIMLAYLAWRGLRNPAYLRRWRERLGWLTIAPPAGGILVHAVSVGEVNGVAPLVHRLMQRWPRYPIVFTCSTPTGSERIRDLFGDSVHHNYLPLDLPGAVRRLYRQVRPRLLVVMETEIWPNLFIGAARRQIPLILVNARLSSRSARAYRRYLPQVAQVMNSISAIAAQTEADAQRFVAAGALAGRVSVCGNLKGDLSVPDELPARAAQLSESWGAQRPVWLGASTHEGEEHALLAAHRALLAQQPKALLVLVPRHPERFDRVVQGVQQLGFRAARHSRPDSFQHHPQVLVVDAMGVLLEYAAAAQLIFVGGSLVPLGGHNPLEPAALAKPVLIGPHHDNIRDLVQLLSAADAAQVVADVSDLRQRVLVLMPQTQRMQRMGRQALAVVAAQRGAVQRTLTTIENLLEGAQEKKRG